MSNINLGQMFNNFANNVNRIVNLGVQNNPAQSAQTQVEQNLDQTMQNIFPKTTGQIVQTSAELNLLNQTQTMNMLKDLLNMPKNLDQLIDQLNVYSFQNSKNPALLLLSSSLNLTQLASLLQNNSKLANTNLYQMIAQFNQVGMSLKDEQLGELTKLISFVSASSNSEVQSLRTTLLMYLPWLPLTDPNAFKLEILEQGADGGAIGEDSVVLLISTVNYGNLQATIYKTEQDGIKIEIVTSETFPQKEILRYIKEESKRYSININTDFMVKSAFNKTGENESKIQVCMNTSPGINPFLILISSAIIKHIHTIDEKETLKEQRKAKLD